MRPLIFGEVLFDRFPDGTSVLGGAPFNVAWHLRGFGLDPLVISRVGEDARGREVIEAMTRWGLDGCGIQTDAGRPTGLVEVTMGTGQHSFRIVADQAYDSIDAGEARAVAAGGEVGLVYHGTLALRDPTSRAALEAVLDGARGAPVFLDVNLRDPWWSGADLPGLCTRARWLKLNEDEVDHVSPAGAVRPQRPERQAAALLDRFDSELVVVTRGARGATARAAGGAAHSVRPDGASGVVDTVGAGDAFSSVVLYGLIDGWPLPTTLERAQDFAAAICCVRGATVDDREFYARHTRRWRTA